MSNEWDGYSVADWEDEVPVVNDAEPEDADIEHVEGTDVD